jgi:hypothetical protein
MVIVSFALFTTTATAQEIQAEGYGYFSCLLRGDGNQFQLVFSSPKKSTYTHSEAGLDPAPSGETEPVDDDGLMDDDDVSRMVNEIFKSLGPAEIRREAFLPIFARDWKESFLTQVGATFGDTSRATCTASEGTDYNGPHNTVDDAKSARVSDVSSLMTNLADAVNKTGGLFSYSLQIDEVNLP